MNRYAKPIGAWLHSFVANLQQKTLTLPPRDVNKYLLAAWQKGGCEGWAQVELTWIFETMPNVAHVQREQSIYADPKKACDFLITYDRKDDQGHNQCAIEIKLESLFHSSDLGRITIDHTQFTEVQRDVDKLRRERRREFAQIPAMALAVTFSQEATEGMDKAFASLLREDSDYKQTFNAMHFDDRTRISTYVIPVT